MRTKIREIVKGIIKELFDEEVEFDIQHPPDEKMGDYSVNAPFLLANKLKKSPNDIAKTILDEIDSEIIESASQIKGFINFRIKKESWLEELTKSITPDYGNGNLGEGKKVLIEFVSANPTGPLTVAHARSAAYGDSLARVLESQSYNVDREYYINDSGNQIKNLGDSVRLKIEELKGKEIQYPPNTYQGEYIEQIAREVMDKNIEDYGEFAGDRILKTINETLKRLRIDFDEWVRESKIIKEGKVEAIITDLQKLKPNPLTEREGALWFTPGNRERVFRRSDGSWTYIVPDIAYHRFKFERGYDLLIDLLGPDHQDHVPELKKSLSLLGYPEEKLEVKIIQWVTLKRGEETVKMSKRQGSYITIDELVDEVGVDAARFFYLLRKSSVPMDFDLELAKEESERNPVYYVQYGHARISSLLELAEEKGYSIDSKENLLKLNKKEEWNLIKKIPEFTETLEDSARIRESHLLTHYLLDISKLYHNFYQNIRILDGNKDLIPQRLFLSNAVRNVIRKGLKLLGVSAPERM
ncbi:arginine--tRNA ligase [candidate division WOR-3 bacterium]|nr:arginine--tRNA ligase [candidate division WOR-3 bacterium]